MDSNGNKCTPIFSRSSQQANESQENSSETSFQWQNFLEDSPYNFEEEDVNYPPSLTLLSQGKNKGLIGDNSASSSSTSSVQGHNPRGQENASRGKGKEPMEEEVVRAPHEETNETFCYRSSMYQGVTRYGNNICEAFQWDNSNTKKPRTGEFNSEEEATRAPYLAPLKNWGESIATNSHPPSNDEDDLKELTRNEYLNSIKRKRKDASKGTSKYRGVCKNSNLKKWQARLGRPRGIRDIYLGSFSSEEEAAQAYDIAAIRLKGFQATTNFDPSQYNVQSILESEKFPIGEGVSRTVKNDTVEDVIKKRIRDVRPRIFTSQNGKSSIFCRVNNPQMPMIPAPNPRTKLSHKNSTNQVSHPNPNSSIFSEAQIGPMFQRKPNWFHGSSSCMGNGMQTDYQENSLGRFCTGRQAVPRFIVENNEDGTEDWDLDIDIQNIDIDPNFLRDFLSDEP